jgi:hypothetical protein
VTTYQAHARIAKKIINRDTDRHLVCGWDDCDRDALDMETYVYCDHPADWPCAYADRRYLATAGKTAHTNFAFCSTRHKRFFIASGGWRALAMIEATGRAYGNLPPGSRGTIL